SQPERRPFTATHVSSSSIDEINATIERLEAGDGTANLDNGLQELEDYLSSQPPNINRVVYLFTDLRRRDWKEGDAAPEAPLKVLARLGKLVQRCYVVDAGEED